MFITSYYALMCLIPPIKPRISALLLLFALFIKKVHKDDQPRRLAVNSVTSPASKHTLCNRTDFNIVLKYVKLREKLLRVVRRNPNKIESNFHVIT